MSGERERVRSWRTCYLGIKASGRLLAVRVNDNLKDSDDAELSFGLSSTQQPCCGRAGGSLLVALG